MLSAMTICLSISSFVLTSPSFYGLIDQSINWLIYISIFPIHPSVRPSVGPSVRPFVHPFIHPFIHPSMPNPQLSLITAVDSFSVETFVSHTSCHKFVIGSKQFVRDIVTAGDIFGLCTSLVLFLAFRNTNEMSIRAPFGQFLMTNIALL